MHRIPSHQRIKRLSHLLLVLGIIASAPSKGQEANENSSVVEKNVEPSVQQNTESSAAKPDDTLQTKNANEAKEEKQEMSVTQAGPPLIDQDGDATPAPILYSFRKGNTFDGKVGTGFLYARTDPFGGTTGYSQLFAEGDWSIFGTGLGLHFDFELRGGLGLFEQRDTTLVSDDPDAEETKNFYRYPGTYVTGRTTDYLRIDRLSLSYDVSLLNLELGRIRVPEASFAVVDGLQVALMFDSFRFGLFGGLKPNPWHQQVVGAASGGFAPVPLNIGSLNEYYSVLMGTTQSNRYWGNEGETTGPYSNELGLGYPWTQIGSYRFQSAGLYSAVRVHPIFLDAALVLDTFIDPNTTLNDAGELEEGSTGFIIDRLWLYTSGGARVFRPLTISWRATLDIIGARPLSPRDLFVDATFRNLGPLRFSASYYKVNTMSTAFSYARFFLPLENPTQLDNITQDDDAGIWSSQPINNTNLFVVDRDRLRAQVALLLGESFETYTELIGERRGDYLFSRSDDAVGTTSTFLSGLGQTDVNQLAEHFYCTGDQNTPITPATLVGTNASVPVYRDRCKVGFSMGARDPVLANVGFADFRYTFMQGYFSTSSRLSGQLGAAILDRLHVAANGGYERNQSARVYSPAPIVDSTGVQEDQGHSYLPKSTSVYEFGANASLRIVAGWHVEANYLAFYEDIPYQGDSDLTRLNGTREDTHQLTQLVFARTLVRF